MEVKDSYAYLRRCIMDCDPEGKYAGLKQCLMPSGKILWLCEEHQNLPRVVLVTGSVAGGYTRPQVEEKSEILKALAKLNERSTYTYMDSFFFNLIIVFLLLYIVANNELPAPALKVPRIESARRSPLDKQSSVTRYSRRYSRQESTLVKSQQKNILEIDENIQENQNGDIQTITNGADNDNINRKQEDETVASSTNCSIM
jgi:hypothetical protein